MPLLSASVDTFILASAIFAVFLHRKLGATNTGHPGLHNAISLFLVLHTLHIIYVLCFFRPPNLFLSLHIPTQTSSDRIRAIILKQSKDGRLPDHLEELLTRLTSFDFRTFYIRFGQNVIQNCDYCRTFSEYALYSLPSLLLPYLREAAIIGLVTIRGTYREKWRTYGIGILVLAAVIEIYWALTVKIEISNQPSSSKVVMWHDTLWIIHNLLFLFLPLVVHFFCPVSASISPLAMVPVTNLALQSLNNRIQLLKFASGAASRSEELRQAAGEFWERQRREGAWMREDEGVNRTAEFAGISLSRNEARQTATALKQGFEPDVFVVGTR